MYWLVMHQDLCGLGLAVHREQFMQVNERDVGLAGGLVAGNASRERVAHFGSNRGTSVFKRLLESEQSNVRPF